MSKCQQCRFEVPEGARFCPQCGAEQGHQVIPCPSCNAKNSADATFCILCGYALKMSETDKRIPDHYKAKYPLDFAETVRLPIQIKTYFLKALQQRLKSEGNEGFFDDYVNLFYESDFQKSFDLLAPEMVEESYRLLSDHSPEAKWQVDQYLSKTFAGLIDAFLIKEGSKLHKVPLSEKVLKYNQKPNAYFDLQELILDYLNLDEENEKWYSDFKEMPVMKLQNALKAFLFVEEEEKIFLICDQTVFGSCREGFAMTEKGLYWKAHFTEPQKVYYEELKSLTIEKDWLKINGQFFNVNPAVNVKMMHLLKKLNSLNVV